MAAAIFPLRADEQPGVTMGLEAAAEEAMRRHMTELMAVKQLSMPLDERDDSKRGSVLAIVNFPDEVGRDCNGLSGFGRVYQLRLDYDRLMAVGSTKIEDMLKPKKQEKYRRLLKIETLPAGVEYVLDFTPPSEGEESAELTASLWLPDATKIWWLSGYYKPSALLASGPSLDKVLWRRPLADKPVGAVLSLGHDDKCICYTTYSDIRDLWAAADDVPGIYPGPWVPKYREIENYCRVRHCVAIVRILRAIAGEDVLVNSATRMWTLAHVALHLDAASLVRDEITQWFSAQPNTKFIEMFPEESFKVASKLQMRDVLLASFKILVSERAVDHAATEPLTRPPPLTWMHRKRTDYGDLPEDPIEHASRAFADRMKARLDTLRSDKAFDVMYMPEWTKLRQQSNRIADAVSGEATDVRVRLLDACVRLMEALLHYFHIHLENTLIDQAAHARLNDLIAAQRAHYAPKETQTTLDRLIWSLNDHQKICLPFFWYNLKDIPDYHLFKYCTYQGRYVTHYTEEYNALLYKALSEHHVTLNDAAYPDTEANLGPWGFQLFNEEQFHKQLDNHLYNLFHQMVGFHDGETDGIPFAMSDHLLLALEESELKYLPLWAGGFDDGSGGVFQDEVPPTDMGPSEPGPHYHTGRTVASSTGGDDTDYASSTTAGGYTRTSTTFSDLGMDGLDLDDDLMAGRSMVAQDSVSTVFGRSEVVSVASEAFTSGDERSMAEAMVAEPAENQALGWALAHYVEGRDGKTEGGEALEMVEDYDEGMESDSTLSLGNRSDDDDFDMI